MEAEEITKLVDGVYKNILEKFNPGARNLISSGKLYLKALHGAAQASRQFNEALAKIAINAQQSGTTDIGAALLSVVNVNKEIQEQQMNILKAFYVDLLVPLETNLEKDTKVVQHEQKKFMQQHKVRMDSYQKAVTTMKKQRKKKSSPENHEKELRSLRLLEDQKKKLDAFCEQSYRNAMTQERRRYGFVLERQCSIAKHWMAYHATGKQIIDSNLENWQEVASSRELIPNSLYSSGFSTTNKRLERVKDIDGAGVSGSSGSSTSAQLKKSRSIDAPYGDMRTLHETNIPYGESSLSRAKSDFNLTMNSGNSQTDHGQWDQRPVVKAIYAYMPSGENQLPFEEGDRIALVGNMANGWQFGENLRTQLFGWFPSAYTNADLLERKKAHGFDKPKFERNNSTPNYHEQYLSDDQLEDVPNDNETLYRSRNSRNDESSPTRMFGDTINLRNQKKYRLTNGDNPRPGPPPTLPAPVPNNQNRMLNSSHSFCVPNGLQSALDRRMNTFKNGPQIPTTSHTSMNHNSQAGNKQSAAPKTSLHSSNDSGFANEPPPQPEVDYSDEEQNNRVPIRLSRPLQNTFLS